MQQIYCSKKLFAKQPSGSVICNNDASLLLAATWMMRWCVHVHLFPRLVMQTWFITMATATATGIKRNITTTTTTTTANNHKPTTTANNQNQPQTTTTNDTAIWNQQISFWPRCFGLSWPTSEGMLVHVGRALASLFHVFSTSLNILEAMRQRHSIGGNSK